MKIDLVRSDEIAYEAEEPEELAEGIFLTADGTIFIVGENDGSLKIMR